ncbi:protein of unknown function [Burkholderia multivorans]
MSARFALTRKNVVKVAPLHMRNHSIPDRIYDIFICTALYRDQAIRATSCMDGPYTRIVNFHRERRDESVRLAAAPVRARHGQPRAVPAVRRRVRTHLRRHSWPGLPQAFPPLPLSICSPR